MRPVATRLVPHTELSAPGRIDKWCLARLVRPLSGAAVTLRLWDGSEVPCSDEPPVAAFTIADRATLMRLVMRPVLEFGEAYAAGRLTVHGDLVGGLEAINLALAGQTLRSRPVRSSRNSEASARENVHVHYDIGNDFYRLWLDESLAYTCAYFERPDATLEEAQRAKFDLVCRKLELAPGDRVVEAGCGWGGLALHMARHYGVTVRAFNVCAAQLEYARDLARREGLDGQVTFIDADYRAIDGRADAFVSIGMLEHVGRDHYADLGEVIDRVLVERRGRGLLHFIGRNRPMEFNAWIARHIFPGAYAPTLAEVLPDVLESRQLSVVDVENLRLHYATTLREWLARFDRRADDVREMFDETFVRTWRLYLASAQACFATGDLQLFQVSFTRPAHNTRAWTRKHLFTPADVPADR